MEDIYYSVLSPAQALLMKYGHQPTDPLETIKKFKTQLNSMNREFSKHTNTLQLVYDKRKYLEHNVEEEVDLKNLDKLIEATKLFNELIDKLSKEKDLEFKRDKMKHIQKIISKILAMMVIQFGETSNNAIKDIQLLVNEGVISNHSQDKIVEVISEPVETKKYDSISALEEMISKAQEILADLRLIQ
ncbi:MAG: hypothetical protein HN769_11015 [Anaerolineae bacterium]|jgi:uncharacterized protein (UPF0332 family)|nr:hypothetical protein [Anaerolineae bacterium]